MVINVYNNANRGNLNISLPPLAHAFLSSKTAGVRKEQTVGTGAAGNLGNPITAAVSGDRRAE